MFPECPGLLGRWLVKCACVINIHLAVVVVMMVLLAGLPSLSGSASKLQCVFAFEETLAPVCEESAGKKGSSFLHNCRGCWSGSRFSRGAVVPKVLETKAEAMLLMTVEVVSTAL